MPLKSPPESPFKEQLRKIARLVGEEENDQLELFSKDVVYLVQKYVTTMNRKVADLQKEVARLEADLDEMKYEFKRNTTTDEVS